MGILRRRLALPLVGIVLILTSLPAQAQLPVRPSESHIDPSLDDVAVSSVDFDELAERFDAARSGREQAQDEVARLRAQERTQAVVVADAETALDRWRRRLTVAREDLRSMAVSAYIGIEGADPAQIAATLTDQSAHLDDSRIVVAGIIGEDRVDTVERTRTRFSRARIALVDARARLVALRDERLATEGERDAFLETELTLAPEVDDARAVARVVGHDLTLVALDAYTAAERSVDPACGLTWSLLAGIGRVESRHGTFGGTRLTAMGETEDRIIGIALTGGGGTARIDDTDGGALDGDTVHDRAVGPMQFIPSTWERWAVDGDDDDIADPHNLYDAAATAAAYLCASGPGLDTDSGRTRAVLSYNRSQAYVRDVVGFAETYATLTI